MTPLPKLYHSLLEVVKQQVRDGCESRLKNMVLLMMGIWLSQSVQLPHVARKLPIRCQKLSLVKRLSRFLENPAIQVREWYHPTAETLVKFAAQSGQIHLIVDGSKVSGHHQLLLVAIAYRGRALPLAWTWVKGSRGHSTGYTQLSLLNYVRTLIPTNVQVSLVGDSEFGQSLVLDHLDFWRWDYALRQAGDNLVVLQETSQWVRLDHLPFQRGQVRFWEHIVLTKSRPCPCHIATYWKPSEKKPWILATNQPSALIALRLYRRRMWIEELFGDLKGHGFDLEASRLQHFQRLSRLTLAVCLLYVWMIALSLYVLTHALQAEVDRKSRRDLSLFRLGWDFLERRLALDDPIPLPHELLFSVR